MSVLRGTGARVTSSGSRGSSVILTVHWFCGDDGPAALNQFAVHLRAALGYVSARLPKPVADKMVAFEAFEATHGDIRFEVVPQRIDAAACEKVDPGELGAVHSSISVKLTPAASE